MRLPLIFSYVMGTGESLAIKKSRQRAPSVVVTIVAMRMIITKKKSKNEMRIVEKRMRAVVATGGDVCFIGSPF